MARHATLSAEELLQLNLRDTRAELVRGQLVVREPAGFRHGEVAARVAAALVAFVYPRQLGAVAGAETGFKLTSSPDTVRAPDVAFVRREKLHAVPDRGYAPLAPDLAVEVLSPGDSPSEVLEKVSDWLDAGTTLVWIIDRRRRTAHVYRADHTDYAIAAGGALDGEDVLAGFRCELESVL